MRFFAGMHVPRCHVNTTLSNTIFSREYQLFACWLKMFFWIRVEKSMLSVHLVLEICGLKVVVSFNFAPSAPHVKRRVKSCEPRAAAATDSDHLDFIYMPACVSTCGHADMYWYVPACANMCNHSQHLWYQPFETYLECWHVSAHFDILTCADMCRHVTLTTTPLTVTI